jgi:hypothetical protein
MVKRLAYDAIERYGGGFEARAPLSGQRALRADLLPVLLPLAHGYGVEVAMTIRALRAGLRVIELDVELCHRSTGRTLGGFIHRGRQYWDVAKAVRDVATTTKHDKKEC